MRPTRERKQTQGFNPDTDGANDTKRKAGASGQQPVPKKRKQARNPVNGKVEKKKNTKESATTSRKTAGKAESKANSPKMWVVVVESAPSGYGCHRGPPLDEIQTILRTDRTVFKGFKSEREAIVKAKAERDGSCYFDDWSEEMYTETQPPPYDSRDGENYDNDDAICIYISDSLEYAERLKKEEERVEKARQKHIKAHGVIHKVPLPFTTARSVFSMPQCALRETKGSEESETSQEWSSSLPMAPRRGPVHSCRDGAYHFRGWYTHNE